MDDLNDTDVAPGAVPQLRDQVVIGPEERAYVYAIARRIVASPQVAEDVTQDALLLAHRHRDAFRGDARYRTWLYRIAATTALGHLRRARRSREQLVGNDTAVVTEVVDPARSPETVVADAELARHAQQAIAQLPPIYRDVMLARSELGEAETAEQLGITVGNVKVRTHRARHQLRRALAG